MIATVIFTFRMHSSTDMTKLEFWAAAGALLGVFLFFRGFVMLRYKRLIMNTPASKVRSASMGLVEINGMAKGPSTIPAGITGEACYYYRAVAWELKQSGRNRSWKQVACESLYVPFFVEDATGKLLVDPQNADLDLHRNFKDEFDTSFFSNNRDILPENVARFLARNAITFNQNIRLEEYCIKPDFPLFVLGTLCTNPHRHSWEPLVHLGSGSGFNSRLNLLGSMGGGMFQSLSPLPSSAVALATATMAASRVSAGSSKPGTPAAAPARTSSWSTVSMDEVALNPRVAPASAGQVSAPRATQQSGPSRLAASVATADPDPTPENSALRASDNGGFDLHPPVCINKGAMKDPFMISWRSQREVVQSLAWKSALCIWGGPALTLGCLYFLAVSLGWT